MNAPRVGQTILVPVWYEAVVEDVDFGIDGVPGPNGRIGWPWRIKARVGDLHETAWFTPDEVQFEPQGA